MRCRLLGMIFALTALPITTGGLGRSPMRSEKLIAAYKVQVSGAALQIDFEAGDFDLPRDVIVSSIQKAAATVATYYGRFPVSRVRILVLPAADEDGVLQGTTWGSMGGWPGFTRLRIGQHTTQKELETNWVMTHELVHMAFASLPDDQHWLEEGIATYVEPIARVQTGELKAEQVWGDMVAGMPNGEPGAGDRGMNRSHTWGRTYWGGALFCLVADVEIRKQTDNRKGLQDALKAIVAAGGVIDTDWPVERLLHVGDAATGTRVLEEMYSQWSEAPVTIDLDQLWKQLGVERSGEKVHLNPVAPLSRIRVMLTTPPKTAVRAAGSASAAVPSNFARH